MADNPSPADEIAELVARLNSHMGLADMQEVLADCRKAATALTAANTRISSLEAQAAAETRLFLDCEFNGFGGELVSMALVAEDGREWYAVLPEPRVWDKWCFEHVLPLISSVKPTIYATTREEFRVSLANWLGAYNNPIIVADWYTDMVHFFSAFGGNDHTQSIAYKCRAELFLDGPELPPEHPHNALSDARAIRDSYRARSGEAR